MGGGGCGQDSPLFSFFVPLLSDFFGGVRWADVGGLICASERRKGKAITGVLLRVNGVA